MTKNLKIIFTVSLLLNIILIGILGGFVYKRIHHDWFYGGRTEFDPETRHMAAKVMRKVRGDVRGEVLKIRVTRSKLMEILEAKRFDESAFDATAEELRKSHDKIVTKKIQATKELAAELPDEERQKLAGRLSEALGERPHHRQSWYKRKQAPKPGEKPAD